MSEYVGPVLLMALAGILLGGAKSLHGNRRRTAAVVCAGIAAVAFAAGLYLIYG